MQLDKRGQTLRRPVVGTAAASGHKNLVGRPRKLHHLLATKRLAQTEKIKDVEMLHLLGRQHNTASFR